jgi:hypothetical protein
VSELWIRRLLYLAGAWNIVGGVSALLDPAGHLAQYGGTFSMADPVQAFFFRATWINVIAWGVGYVLAARHSAARGPVLLSGGAGKLAYFVACVALYLTGQGSAVLLGAGIFDVICAAFFLYVVWRPRVERSIAEA